MTISLFVLHYELHNPTYQKKAYTGYPHLDAYAEARKTIAFQSLDTYHKILQAERYKTFSSPSNANTKAGREESGGGDRGTDGGNGGGGSGTTSARRLNDWKEMDAAARDAVRCLEHAMVIVAGEKVG